MFVWYRKNAMIDAKQKLITAFIRPRINSEMIHSENFNGATKRLSKFLFHSSSRRPTVISYWDRHVMIQSMTPDNSINTRSGTFGRFFVKNALVNPHKTRSSVGQ